MTIKEVKEIVKGMEMSAEALLKVDEMMAGMGDDTEVGDEFIDKILAIMDAEIDANQLAGDIFQNGADMAEELLQQVDQESKQISEGLEEIIDKDKA